VMGSYVLAERQHERSRRMMVPTATLSMSHPDEVVPAR
jgi:hypothetical protein